LESKRRVEEWISFVGFDSMTMKRAMGCVDGGVAAAVNADAGVGVGLGPASASSIPLAAGAAAPNFNFDFHLHSNVNVGASLGMGTGMNLGFEVGGGRTKRHVLSLPTELLATIFELANEECPFLGEDGGCLFFLFLSSLPPNII
jgi:hypothetical protein